MDPVGIRERVATGHRRRAAPDRLGQRPTWRPPVPVIGIGPDDSARSLLDAAVSSPAGCAVRVDDDGRVVGLVRYESIGKLLADRLKAVAVIFAGAELERRRSSAGTGT